MPDNIWTGGEDQENMDVDGEQQEGAAVAARRRKKVRAHCGVSHNDHGSLSILPSGWNLCLLIFRHILQWKRKDFKLVKFDISVVIFNHFVLAVVFTWWFCTFRAERVKLSKRTFPSWMWRRSTWSLKLTHFSLKRLRHLTREERAVYF